MSDAREAMLGRVRRALADRPQAQTATYAPISRLDDPVGLFAARAAQYRANVHRCEPAALAAFVAGICEAHGARRLAVPAGLTPGWVPDGVEVVLDPPVELLDAVDGVLTGCALAVAETGTIILDGGAGQGARALTLVPDLHICVVMSGQVVPGVPEAVAAMAASVRERRAPLTMISGPSATSDIELSRVEGVHGPRRLELLVCG
jgi:L-lactate dehydrogenase complex protein LldG